MLGLRAGEEFHLICNQILPLLNKAVPNLYNNLEVPASYTSASRVLRAVLFSLANFTAFSKPAGTISTAKTLKP